MDKIKNDDKDLIIVHNFYEIIDKDGYEKRIKK